MDPVNFTNRRDFLKAVARSGCALGLLGSGRMMTAQPSAFASPVEKPPPLREVMFYKKLESRIIECGICPKKCRIADLERGYCGNKENIGGIYYTMVYSKPCAVHIDPIEKKPLFHYLPSTMAFSMAAAGCNFECRFCQNWKIAQYRPEQVDSLSMEPGEVVGHCTKRGIPTIAYTYTEPVVFYGYMHDCAKAGQKAGIGSVMISNGFINEEPLRELCRYLSGVKIDLKSFSEAFYRDYCSGELEPVLSTLKLLKKIGLWLEIVVLVIPTLNDSPAEITRMCAWIRENLGPDVPLHFSRFHPMYKIKNLPPTPVKTLDECFKIASSAGLHYVYLGNVTGHPAESTVCPRCGKVVIKRMGYSIIFNKVQEGACAFCSYPIAGVWTPPPPIAS